MTAMMTAYKIFLLNFLVFGVFSSKLLTSSLSVAPDETKLENFPKKISAIFFAVISINLEPTWAILPPTFASTLYVNVVIPSFS